MDSKDVVEIDTLEEFTTHCLDRSLEGLETLRRDCIRCGETLLENQAKGFTQLPSLCEGLNDFYVFEGDVRTMFMLDTEQLRDRCGTLKETEDLFEKSLNEMPAMLESQALPDLSKHLKITLPGIIDRFQDLIPALRNFIEDEYINYQQ